MSKSRKHPAHGVEHKASQPTVVYDTVCTASKRAWLATPEMHDCLIKVWRDDATSWLVGRYVVMPDHVHYFAWATPESRDYQNWVKYWKSKFSKSHGKKNLRMQSDNWDTRMRCESQYEEKWQYVRQNPVRAGLVENADHWEFSGVVYDLKW